MRGAERVVFALGALGETGQPAALAQGADAIAAPGQNLVRIGLVSDVPDQFVVGRVEHGVQRHRQLDDAQSGAEMAAGIGYCVDGLGPQFVGELLELLKRQIPHVAGQVNAVEQRCFGRFRHKQTPRRERAPASKSSLNGLHQLG